jgi:hypothetical protein
MSLSKPPYSASRVNELAAEYLDEIQTNISVMNAWLYDTDLDGKSRVLNDPDNAAESWKAVNAGTLNVMTRMEERGLGTIINDDKFQFKLYYFSNYRVTAAITLATLDLSGVLTQLPADIVDITKTDSDKFNDINASSISLESVTSTLKSFNNN